MTMASISEAKNRFSALIDRVRNGDTVVITDRGRPVARLEPAITEDDAEGRLARLERAGHLKRATAPSPSKLILNTPPPKPRKGGDILKFLLEERREGR